jgi:hypothetical protein
MRENEASLVSRNKEAASKMIEESPMCLMVLKNMLDPDQVAPSLFSFYPLLYTFSIEQTLTFFPMRSREQQLALVSKNTSFDVLRDDTSSNLPSTRIKTKCCMEMRRSELVLPSYKT